jgi:hypothetical protein
LLWLLLQVKHTQLLLVVVALVELLPQLGGLTGLLLNLLLLLLLVAVAVERLARTQAILEGLVVVEQMLTRGVLEIRHLEAHHKAIMVETLLVIKVVAAAVLGQRAELRYQVLPQEVRVEQAFQTILVARH